MEVPINLFFGEVTETRALLYARAPSPPDLKGAILRGDVTGPRCRTADCLPCTVRFEDKGPGATFLARAVLPDPCCWSPQLPALYDIRVTLERNGEVLAQYEHPLAIRRLGARRPQWVWDGQPYVLRAAKADLRTPAKLEAWREAGVAVVLRELDPEVMREAAECGVPVGIDLQQPAESDVRAIARYGAVCFGILEASGPLALDPRLAAPNVLWLARAPWAARTTSPPEWAHSWLCRAPADAAETAADSRATLPVMLERPTSPLEAAAALAAGGELESAFPPGETVAGYVV